MAQVREFIGGPKDGEPVPAKVTAPRYICPGEPQRPMGVPDIIDLDALEGPPRFATYTYVKGPGGHYYYEGRTE